MRPYNVEIFTPKYTFRSSGQKDSFGYREDYLNIESNTIELSGIKAEVGDYIRISGTEITEGIITSVEPETIKQKITYRPHISVLEVDAFCDISLLSNVSLEVWLADIISETYIENTDVFQNISGLELDINSDTRGMLSVDTSIVKISDLVLQAFVKYGIVVTSKMKPNEKKLLFNLERKNTGILTVEADLPNVLDRYFKVGKTDAGINKVTIVNQNNSTQTAIFYKHLDDSISKINSNRVLPVIFTVATIATESFEADAYQKAEEILLPSKYENLIELTVAEHDQLVKPRDFFIGQEVNVIHNNRSYRSVYTGYLREKGKIKLIFGAIRNELTKKLRR